MSFDLQRRGIVCIVSGPSGSGKTTLCRALSASDERCDYAVSCTTRKPRTGEVDGRDYHFLSREDFEARTTRGEFLEWAEVHGNLYGTLKRSVLDLVDGGRDVLMDIDVQGAALVRNNPDPAIRDSLVDVFILLPDRDEMVKRLSGRGTEDAAEMDLRLRNAMEEMRHWRDYAYTIVSGTPEEDLRRFRAIVEGERCRTRRLHGDRSSESHPDFFG
ncbi:MAG: guanylate kinase [Verrucomicrobiae bacterium]|nr:guanylate kinase [Verrucomicrobiae bacterium]MCB1088334.1 guanylate kinase [Verrucomicrobiae bacterium]MCB1090361.1 guanylate kinase [Verrucomicrobiae bacterium]